MNYCRVECPRCSSAVRGPDVMWTATAPRAGPAPAPRSAGATFYPTRDRDPTVYRSPPAPPPAGRDGVLTIRKYTMFSTYDTQTDSVPQAVVLCAILCPGWAAHYASTNTLPGATSAVQERPEMYTRATLCMHTIRMYTRITHYASEHGL